jgi:hypothetical protein
LERDDADEWMEAIRKEIASLLVATLIPVERSGLPSSYKLIRTTTQAQEE